MSMDATEPTSAPAPHEQRLTADTVLGGRVTLHQPAAGYRAAIDPVLLAAAVSAQPGARIVDLGCGVGTAGLCLLARLPEVTCIGIDKQQVLVDLARRNAAESGFGSRYQAHFGNILDNRSLLSVAGRADQVIVNPPYLPLGRASLSDHPIKALANAESDAVLADWVEAAAALVAPRGAVTFIHRADRLPELLSLMQQRFGALAILPIQPKAGEPARRVIVRGIRGNGAPSQLLPALILHDAEGLFTPQAQAVLRDAAAIAI
jgi:tRNA1(Val) A37 N6-methylase TrmN6